MSKQEFVAKLRVALNGKLPASKVEETANYYQDYINTEIRKGKSEEEVMELLGDPRLIARTIIQTNGSENSGVGGEYDFDPDASARQNGYSGFQAGGWFQRIPRWLIILIAVAIVLVVLAVVFSVLSALAPFIFVMAVVIFLIKLFRDWLN